MHVSLSLSFLKDMLSVYLEKAKSVATKSKNLISGTKTTKGKPTIGDTFRTQLLALVDTLDATTPWSVIIHGLIVCVVVV